jgi:hypothetical protein
MSTFVGLDVHSEHTFATVLDRDGTIVVQRKMVNELVPSFLKLFSVERVGLEASTHVAPLYRALVDEGYRVRFRILRRPGTLLKQELKVTGWILGLLPNW